MACALNGLPRRLENEAMNLLYADIVDVFEEEGMRLGTVRVGGATRMASLGLLDGAEPGMRVLLCDGVAIAQVEDETETEISNVPCNTR
jgi:hydrogenase maturation factor